MRDINIWIIVVLTIIFWWAVISLLFKYLRYSNRLKLRELFHKERIAAIEKGISLPELPEDTLEHLSEEKMWESYSFGNHRINRLALALGLVLLFGGIGFIISMSIFHDLSFGLLGVIPIMIGIGLLIYYHLTKESNQKDKKAQQD
jgi:hypothetical protein